MANNNNSGGLLFLPIISSDMDIYKAISIQITGRANSRKNMEPLQFSTKQTQIKSLRALKKTENEFKRQGNTISILTHVDIIAKIGFLDNSKCLIYMC